VASLTVSPRKSAKTAPLPDWNRRLSSLTFSTFWALGMALHFPADRISSAEHDKKTSAGDGGGERVIASWPRQVPRWGLRFAPLLSSAPGRVRAARASVNHCWAHSGQPLARSGRLAGPGRLFRDAPHPVRTAP